jgi:hypothetical protein
MCVYDAKIVTIVEFEGVYIVEDFCIGFPSVQGKHHRTEIPF